MHDTHEGASISILTFYITDYGQLLMKTLQIIFILFKISSILRTFRDIFSKILSVANDPHIDFWCFENQAFFQIQVVKG